LCGQHQFVNVSALANWHAELFGTVSSGPSVLDMANRMISPDDNGESSALFAQRPM
jgi:hypothetical protein